MIYELIQPSDPIHFKAESDKIAYFCALILGNGKAGIERADGAKCESPLYVFHPDPMPEIEAYLGGMIADFGDQNCAEIAACFASFAYGSQAEYRTYCEAVNSITDPENLKAFQDWHEDKNRSSMSKWVKSAWQYAEYFKNKANEPANS
jgi:hypothetical protein